LKVIASGKYVVLDGGATWPTPMDDPDNPLEWRLRYAPAEIVVKDRFLAASIVNAYRELIALPATKRNKVIASLRRAINGEADVRNR
jgi:hypothetical protein